MTKPIDMARTLHQAKGTCSFCYTFDDCDTSIYYCRRVDMYRGFEPCTPEDYKVCPLNTWKE